MRLGVVIAVVAGFAACPASSLADVTVFSSSDGSVHIIEDGQSNDVHFTDAVHGESGGAVTDFGTEVWNTSGGVNMQGGCLPYSDPSRASNAVICGSSAQSNAITLEGGSGGGSIVYDVTEWLGSDDIPLRSIAINGGTGSKTIDLSLLVYNTSSGTRVDAGGGSDTIKGGAGDLTIHGGSGNDRILFGSGHDVLYLDSGNQDAEGCGGGSVAVHDGTGNNTVIANNGCAAPENMTFYGEGAGSSHPGVDRITCDVLGNDVVYADPGDVVNGTCTKVYVSRAPCVVPSVVGRSLAAAERAIRGAHCAVGSIRRQKRRGPAGRVVSQSRRAGQQLNPGSRVSLVVSRR